MPSPSKATNWRVRIRRDGRDRVVLLHSHGELEFRPLDAAHLSGRFLAAALDLINPQGGLGVEPRGARAVLWIKPGKETGWQPTPLSSIREIEAEIGRCQDLGLPYRLTVDLITDPLEPAPNRAANHV